MPVVFVVSFGESFVLISFAFPGTSVLLAAGALIAAGNLPFWPIVAGAVCGAVLGDAISYWLGRRYGHLTETRWPFTRHPEILPRGHAFFARHGVKSVFIGRFFGPLRSVIPLIAGITRMPKHHFWIANVLSALIWAPVLLVPGAVATYALTSMEVGVRWKAGLTVAAMLLIAGLIWAGRRLGHLGRQ
jgi:membrane protein DedA with SNARE-associated domain